MNKLPKVFANPINHKLHNEQNDYRSYKDNVKTNKISTLDIDKIFSKNNHIGGSKVRMLINNNFVEKIIVTKNNNYLITIDNEKIKLDDIEFIEII